MRVMVTGSEGYIGSCLAPALARSGAEVVRFDAKLGDDLLDYEKAASIARGCDLIVHLAGLVGIAACENDPGMAHRINVNGTGNLLGAQKPMIFASVLAGYRGHEQVDEETPVFPTATYYKTKIDAEALVGMMQSTVLRFGALYGLNPAAMRDDLLVHSFCKEAVRTGKVTVFQPEAMRPLTYLWEAVRAIRFMAEKPRPGIFNVVSCNLRKKQIVREIQQTWGCRIESVEGKDDEGRDYAARMDKMWATGFRYQVPSFEDALDAICDWYELCYPAETFKIVGSSL